jgi:hypothetical protein
MNWSRTILLTYCVLALALPARAQWPKHLNPGVQAGPDGKPNLDGPPPKAADGHVDLSGVWESGGGGTAGALRPATPQGRAAGAGPAPAGRGAGSGQGPAAAGRGAGRGQGAPGAGRGGAPPPRGGGHPIGNSGVSPPGGPAPYQDWAAALVKQRMADNSKDNPDAHCLPMGIMQLTAHPYPKKIIQTPSEVVMIYEGSGTTVREIFLDRQLPKPEDVEPWWDGYSVGHWDGDTLVVETTGFIDGWLDVRGSPITNAGKVIERYRRPSFGRLEIGITIDDPKAYTKPFDATVNNHLSADTQLIEFVCLDKDAQHYVGATAPK